MKKKDIKILLVDDEQDILEIVGYNLSQVGYQIVTASNGKEAIAKQKAEGVKQKIVGIELADKAIPRHGYDVLFNGNKIGEVTTGYHSISTDKSVCMALIASEYSKIGTQVDIQIRKKTFKGVVIKKKFYEKHYKKY